MLTPLAPFIAWANAVFDDGVTFEDGNEDEGETVFLGPEVDTIAAAHAFVLKHYDYFFDHYLESWCVEPSLWPQRRTRKMFKEWFAIRIHSVVEDVVDAPLERD